VPGIVGTVISKGLATLHEIDTVYGTQDLYDMLEIIAVDNHNQRIINKPGV
jgi:4-diphosphocytidyl-2C-methyl-D-erythritol kinase